MKCTEISCVRNLQCCRCSQQHISVLYAIAHSLCCCRLLTNIMRTATILGTAKNSILRHNYCSVRTVAVRTVLTATAA